MILTVKFYWVLKGGIVRTFFKYAQQNLSLDAEF